MKNLNKIFAVCNIKFTATENKKITDVNIYNKQGHSIENFQSWVQDQRDDLLNRFGVNDNRGSVNLVIVNNVVAWSEGGVGGGSPPQDVPGVTFQDTNEAKKVHAGTGSPADVPIISVLSKKRNEKDIAFNCVDKIVAHEIGHQILDEVAHWAKGTDSHSVNTSNLMASAKTNDGKCLVSSAQCKRARAYAERLKAIRDAKPKATKGK